MTVLQESFLWWWDKHTPCTVQLCHGNYMELCHGFVFQWSRRAWWKSLSFKKKVFHESHFKYVTYLKLNHVRSVKANLIPSCRWWSFRRSSHFRLRTTDPAAAEILAGFGSFFSQNMSPFNNTTGGWTWGKYVTIKVHSLCILGQPLLHLLLKNLWKVYLRLITDGYGWLISNMTSSIGVHLVLQFVVEGTTTLISKGWISSVDIHLPLANLIIVHHM